MNSQRRLASLAAAVLVTGGGAFAAGQLEALTSTDGGADTPEAAVDAMFQSLSENDILGVLDTLAPGEREVVRDATVDYVEELTRLGILSDDIDLSGVPGFDLEFSAMTYAVEQANPRVWLVTITGGQVTAGADIADLPLGDLLLDRLDLDEFPSEEPITVDLAEAAAEEPVSVAVVEDGGQYYVSSYYTFAELAASQAGYEMPATPITPVGAASPEEAVRAMIDAGLNLDVAGLIGMTPPDEMAALYDYGQILVDLASEAMTDSDLAEFTQLDLTVDDLELEEVAVTGGTKLVPVKISVSASVPGEGDFALAATKVGDTCAEYELIVTEQVEVGTPQEATVSGGYCASDLSQLFEGQDVPPEVQQIATRMVTQLGEVGAVTVEVDGSWYVSPTRSYSDLLLVALQGLEPGDLETLIDFVEASSGVEFEEVLEQGPGMIEEVVPGGVAVETLPPKVSPTTVG